MRVKIYDLPHNEFYNRILKDKNYVSYYQFLETIGKLSNTHSDKEEQARKIEEIIKTKDTIVITTSDLSSLHSHVFENISTIIDFINDKELFDLMIINAPSKPLRKIIDRYDNVTTIDCISYDKPSEKTIVNLKNNIDNSIIGQKNTKKEILRSLIGFMVRPTSKPLILMFYGNPGIGKTETAKYMSKELYNTDRILIEQMSMSYGENSVAYYKSPKYSEDSFTKSLIYRTGNLILLDEFSLAPKYIIDAFYQLFDEGIYEDKYFKVNMQNSIIILTSNVLSKEELYESLSPALYSRIDNFIKFKDFTSEEVDKIIEKTICDYITSNQIAENYLELIDFDIIEKKLKKLSKKIKNFREIRSLVEGLISDDILNIIIEQNNETKT